MEHEFIQLGIKALFLPNVQSTLIKWKEKDTPKAFRTNISRNWTTPLAAFRTALSFPKAKSEESRLNAI